MKICLLTFCFVLETNQIHDYTYNGKFVKDVSTTTPQCVLCEFIMKEIDDKLKDKSDEVIQIFIQKKLYVKRCFRTKSRRLFMEFVTIYLKQ